MRPVAPRRAATAAAAAGRAAPRSRAAELAFTNLIHVKAIPVLTVGMLRTVLCYAREKP